MHYQKRQHIKLIYSMLIGKKMKNYLMICAMLSCILYSCNISKSDLVGVYNSPNLKNNVDTLILYDNGIYDRKLYFNKHLILHQKDNWKFIDSKLTLDNFFVDQDNLYSPQKKFKSGSMRVIITPKKYSGTIEIDYSDFLDHKYFYRKINRNK